MRTLRSFVVLGLMVISQAVLAEEVRDKAEVDYGTDNLLSLGMGYDFIKGRAVQKCLKQVPRVKTGGTETLYTIDRIESYKELLEQMNISAGASLKFASGGGGSLKMRYAHERKVTSQSVFVLVRTLIRAPTLQMEVESLSDRARALLSKRRGDSLFRKACGDAYVAGLETGGEFYGILRFDVNSQAEKSMLEAKLEGNYGAWSGSGEFSRRVEEIARYSKVSIVVYQGGVEPGVFEPTPDGLIKAALDFPAKFFSAQAGLGDDALVNSYLMKDYASLIALEGLSVSPISVENQKGVLRRLSGFAADAEGKLNDIAFVFTNRDLFESFDEIALTKSQQALVAMKDRIVRNAELCYNDINQCKQDDQIVTISVSLPSYRGCLKPLWNEKEDPVCGVASYKTQRHAVCGIESYKRAAGEVCGVKSYKTGVCGTDQWNETADDGVWVRRGGRHDPDRYMDHSCGANWQQAHAKCVAKGGTWLNSCINYGGVGHYACSKPKYCEKPEFGVKEYKSCRHSSFGVETYKACQHESFGVERYEACRLPQFGLDRCLDG